MSDPQKTGKRKEGLAGVVVISVEDRHLFALVACLLVGLIGFMAVFAITQRHTTDVISKNTDDIGDNTDRIDRQETRDVIRLRRADARLCARENLVRAEVHVAYQQQQPMPPPEAFVEQPILKVLLDQAREIQDRGLQRVRTNLPILECAPNLKGRPAYPLLPEKQKRFVELYVEGRLSAVPNAGDAVTGPDE